MSARRSNAPAWLFSFVDLAFLMLIAMTQIGSRAELPPLGEILVPRLSLEASDELEAGAPTRWQLRIHSADEVPPFELLRAADVEAARAGAALTTEALGAELARLRAGREPRPLLVPHRDSRSEDLLVAASLLETHWPERRRVLVSPLGAAR